MTTGLIFSFSIAILLVGCVIALVMVIRKMLFMQTEMEERIQQLSDMNLRLRENRHDYLNTMQIVYGMVELEEYEELHAYLEPMYQDIMKTSKALKTAKPAVNALLMAKMAEAEQTGIELFLEVKSNLKNLQVVEWELCRILSNLIDNAFRAVKEAGEDKRVVIDITESREEFMISVIDYATEIPKEIQEKIFQSGFTTKKEEGHGMGLSIVSKLVDKNGGSITLQSDQKETNFQIHFTKK